MYEFFSHLSIEINEMFTNEYTKLVISFDFLKGKKNNIAARITLDISFCPFFLPEKPKI